MPFGLVGYLSLRGATRRGNPEGSVITDSQARPSKTKRHPMEGRACETAGFTPWLCGSVREMYSVVRNSTLRASKDWIAAL
ncbi:MAG: hypothetical protein VCA36_09415 [Opitutales bacterium]